MKGMLVSRCSLSLHPQWLVGVVMGVTIPISKSGLSLTSVTSLKKNEWILVESHHHVKKKGMVWSPYI
jgi:hypothetical protein